MKDFLLKLLASLDTHSKGFSGRKLSAFIIMTCVVVIHIKWIAIGDFSQLEMVLTIDYAFVAAMFGLTTYAATRNKN